MPASATAATAAEAGVPTVAISGDVRSRSDGVAVAGAAVALRDVRDGTVATTSTANDGSFTFADVSPGSFTIVVSARGFRSERSATIDARRSRVVHVTLSLANGELSDIVRVTSRPARTVDAGASLGPNALGATATGRTSDALGRLPGVDVSGDAGSPGGDAYVSLRGLRPGEAQNLLDGHPVGPLGVGATSPDADGVIEGYDLQDAPYFALRDLDVTFGSGPAGDWGIDSVGGAVDARTLEPTQRRTAAFELGGGTQGRQVVSLAATGTSGAFGYAVVHGVEGTNGSFPDREVAQTGLRGTDFTSATLAALTYPVSGDYVLRNDLANVTYRPNVATKIAFSAYDATSWADKTGEGDNDANPYAYTLFNAPVGIAPGCPAGVLVSTNAGSQCLPPATYAREASGPAGGGPGAWQAFRNQDYAASVERVAGAQRFALDGFADDYALEYHRSASAVTGALDAFDDLWQTTGVRASDTLTGANDVARFGLVWLRQVLSGDETSPDGSALVRGAPSARIDRAFTIDDAHAIGSRLTFAFDANLSTTSVDPALRFAPRVAIRYDATPRDAFRLAAGSAASEPSLELDRVQLTPPGALNPDCGALRIATPSAPATVVAGSAPARGLSAESALDVEVGYDRRVGNDATFGATAYDTNVRDRIVTGSLPAGSALSAPAMSAIDARIGAFCGSVPPGASVRYALTSAFNAGGARARGIELSGRLRATPFLRIEYAYDIQSLVLDDIPAAALATDATLVDGAQAFGVPLHKAEVDVDFSLRPGLDARVDAHYVGVGNPQQLPGYAYADATVSERLSKSATLTLAGTNVFDSHASAYGQVGLGVSYPTNAANARLASPFVQPFDERFGLSPAAVTLGLTLRI